MSRDAKDDTGKTVQEESGNEYRMIRNRIRKASYAGIIALLISVILIILELYLPAGILVILTAILELNLVRATLRSLDDANKSLRDVSSSNYRKVDVISSFSHRIREPLNNIVIITDLLMESGLQKKQKELLETFVASTKNMVTTVNELTMQSAGDISFEPRKHIRFSLLPTIQNTIELYNLKDKANIDFILNKKELTDFECFGDPIILKQIFLDIFNTIENNYSEKATKVTISLRKEREADNENFVGLRIQTDRNLVLIDDNEKTPGLSARLIHNNKGYWSQESGADYTVLNITLPFTKVVSEPKHKLASNRIEELIQKEKVHKELKDIRILLVEDNLINQKITHLTLKPLVASIDTASNGKEALDKFGSAKYDLILMDIQMPVMSGLTAAEKIRALESSTNTHVPIVAITANAMLGDKEKCLSAGIDDYISKPFQPSALIEKIKKLI
jgi:CheY-like chemotaxis protein